MSMLVLCFGRTLEETSRYGEQSGLFYTAW